MTYFADSCVGAAGLLGPVPDSPHAARVAIAITNNSTWLIVFIDFSHYFKSIHLFDVAMSQIQKGGGV